ncbi:protoheme IX farnesyltransferase [Parvibaculum indicum]|uniref:heme o synthase n=1 Tax=Parvibaculum indicum TaxID=562969 RepID=UPI001423A7BF|nr:heme o synthase [Parvibaculum indicum]NIJ41765.1 protoheme IX farnesyltransferase [Parvibaculum indicum]
MSDTAFTENASSYADGGMGTAGDFFELLKPRVMSLVVFTALVGLVVAPGGINPVIGFTALLCIAVGAGASGALNMWYDADIDARMTRTRTRPVPSGRVTPQEAAVFGTVMAAGSVFVMGALVNWTAAALLAFTIFFYAVIYTMWLKRSTPQNIVIGGAAGAFPPMIAWAAVTGDVSLQSISLFLIIFMWTPPHFWALALCKSGDYEEVGVPMLPVVAGERETRRQIMLYSLLLVPVTLSPVALGFAGWLYAGATAGLGVVFLALAARLARCAPAPDGDKTAQHRAAMRLFGFSILYLFLIFSLLLVEKMAGIAPVFP